MRRGQISAAGAAVAMAFAAAAVGCAGGEVADDAPLVEGPPAGWKASVEEDTVGICPRPRHHAIVRRPSRVNWDVVNGVTYDCGGLRIDRVRRVVVPANAVVARIEAHDEVRIRTRRVLDFAGHPGGLMKPEFTRENMGPAWRLEDATLYLATYGEWESRIEGGATVAMRVEVPPGLVVERQRGLSGPSSLASAPGGPTIEAVGRWYASTSPGLRWHDLVEWPDPTVMDEPESFWAAPVGRLAEGVRAAYRDCYDEALEATPDLRGKIVLDVHLRGEPTPQRVEVVANETGSQALADCVKAAALHHAFAVPLYEPEVVVQVPLVFDPDT